MTKLWRFINEELCPTGHPKTSAKASNEHVLSENITRRSENNFIDLLPPPTSDRQWCDYCLWKALTNLRFILRKAQTWWQQLTLRVCQTYPRRPDLSPWLVLYQFWTKNGFYIFNYNMLEKVKRRRDLWCENYVHEWSRIGREPHSFAHMLTDLHI